MTDEVRTALALIVARGHTDPLVAQAAVTLGNELERLLTFEERVRDERPANGRYVGHDTYSQAQLDLVRDLLGEG